MNKKALIFGISGQDGYFLTKLLLSKNYLVYGCTRDLNQNFHFEKKLVKIFEINKYNKKNILTIIENIKPDEIYNLSGLSSVAKSFRKSKETFKSIVETNFYILQIFWLTASVEDKFYSLHNYLYTKKDFHLYF